MGLGFSLAARAIFRVGYFTAYTPITEDLTYGTGQSDVKGYSTIFTT